MDTFYLLTFGLTAVLAAFLQFNHLLPPSLQHRSTAAAQLHQKQRLSSSQSQQTVGLSTLYVLNTLVGGQGALGVSSMHEI